MFKRPINEMLHSSLESLSNLIDSSKVIGKPIQIGEDKIVVPISKVTLGFGVGGSEFNVSNKKNKKLKNELSFEVSDELYPYGGGQLGGMSIVPEAFLIVSNNKSEIVYFDKNPSLFLKTIDLIKDIIKK
ncbi:MAG: spore germination protein GerW family protein [Bacillales bacterium]|nr:spore germination protein GerW family protein [Bacillales bacterium]